VKLLKTSIMSATCYMTLVGLVAFGTLVPATAQASAVNCDYRTWYGFISGDKGSYAQCINVRGTSDKVRKISISFTGYVWTTFGPGVSIPPVPNVNNICNSIMQVEWHRINARWPTRKSFYYGCHRPLVDESQEEELNFSIPVLLKDRSKVCMRYKSNEFNSDVWTPKTCITIKK